MVFDSTIITSHSSEILSGLALTLEIWLAGSALSVVVGFSIACIGRLQFPPISIAVTTYLTLFRGTPFLIQLFILYYGGPQFGVVLEPVTAGIIGLTLYGAAYFAEIFRAGFDSVHKGQIEAGQIFGLSHAQIIFRVELPQMLVIILPSLVSMFIILSKETAVLSVITVPELTAILSGIGFKTFTYIEPMITLLVIYWLIVGIVSALGAIAERKVSRFIINSAQR